jgi:hypothetical protein
MESRKRPLADEDDSVVTKKRILTGANGSPHVNGVAEHDDEAFGEKLEAILLSNRHILYTLVSQTFLLAFPERSYLSSNETLFTGT